MSIRALRGAISLARGSENKKALPKAVSEGTAFILIDKIYLNNFEDF